MSDHQRPLPIFPFNLFLSWALFLACDRKASPTLKHNISLLNN